MLAVRGTDHPIGCNDLMQPLARANISVEREAPVAKSQSGLVALLEVVQDDVFTTLGLSLDDLHSHIHCECLNTTTASTAMHTPWHQPASPTFRC